MEIFKSKIKYTQTQLMQLNLKELKNRATQTRLYSLDWVKFGDQISEMLNVLLNYYISCQI